MRYMPTLTEKQLPDSKYFYTVSFTAIMTFMLGAVDPDARIVQ